MLKPLLILLSIVVLAHIMSKFWASVMVIAILRTIFVWGCKIIEFLAILFIILLLIRGW